MFLLRGYEYENCFSGSPEIIRGIFTSPRHPREVEMEFAFIRPRRVIRNWREIIHVPGFYTYRILNVLPEKIRYIHVPPCIHRKWSRKRTRTRRRIPRELRVTYYVLFPSLPRRYSILSLTTLLWWIYRHNLNCNEKPRWGWVPPRAFCGRHTRNSDRNRAVHLYL